MSEKTNVSPTYVMKGFVAFTFGIDKVARTHIEPRAIREHLIQVCIRKTIVLLSLVFCIENSQHLLIVSPHDVRAEGHHAANVQMFPPVLQIQTSTVGRHSFT